MSASPFASILAMESRIDNAIAENATAAGLLSTMDSRLASKLEQYSASKQDVGAAALALAARLEMVRDVFAAERAGSADHMTGAAEFAALILADVSAIAALASADRAALTSPADQTIAAIDPVPVATEAPADVVASVTGRGAKPRSADETAIAPPEAPASVGATVNRIVDVIPHGWESTETPEETVKAAAREAEKVGAHKSNGRRRKTAAK